MIDSIVLVLTLSVSVYTFVYGVLITNRAVSHGDKMSVEYLLGFIFIVMGTGLLILFSPFAIQLLLSFLGIK